MDTPAPPLAAGTPHPKGDKTHEQVARLAEMRDPAFELGVARAEHVNSVIHPDGTVTRDTDAMVKAAEAAVAEILTGDPTDPATFDRAAVAARKVQEIVSHIAANRFVFLLDRFHIPTTYFQAATPENVDIFPPEPAEPDAAPASEPASDAPATDATGGI